MSRVILFLGMSLVLLGILIYGTLDLVGQVGDLQQQNTQMANEAEQARQGLVSCSNQRDALITEKQALLVQVDQLEQELVDEQQAHQSAVSEVTFLRSLQRVPAQNIETAGASDSNLFLGILLGGAAAIFGLGVVLVADRRKPIHAHPTITLKV